MPRRAEVLTAKRVESLRTDRVQQDFADGLVAGLALRVARSGKKTWTLMYKSDSKTRRLKIGTFPTTSLSDARKLARAELQKVERGRDPAAERKDRRAGKNSFREMAEEIRQQELDVRIENGSLRESTYREWSRILDTELIPIWGDVPVSKITRRDVRALAERIAARGAPMMARSVVRFINHLFNRGVDREFPGLTGNPAYRMQLPWKQGTRDRYLTRRELKTVWQALDKETPGVKGSFRLAMLSAQRMGSITTMKWSDVEGDLWTIPAEFFKSKRKHLVPLSPETIAVIEELKESAGSTQWTFPSSPAAKQPYMRVWNSALRRVRNRTPIPSWVLHDTRTTLRTHAVRSPEEGGLGIATNIVDQILGHRENTIGSMHYQGDLPRYMLAEKRDALTKWGGFVAAAVKAKYDDDE